MNYFQVVYYLLKNVDFHELWNSDGMTQKYKDTFGNMFKHFH